MTSARAILVNDRREAIELDRGRGPSVVARYDNAGDQLRTHWCMTHNHEAFDRKYEGYSCPHGYRCRVVSAIVVPLEEDAA